MIDNFNRNFGKLENGCLQYAPLQLEIDGKIFSKPTTQQYRNCGWKQIYDKPPVLKDGYQIVKNGYSQTYMKVIANYEYEEIAVLSSDLSASESEVL